jgi:hypothetical protein
MLRTKIVVYVLRSNDRFPIERYTALTVVFVALEVAQHWIVARLLPPEEYTD